MDVKKVNKKKKKIVQRKSRRKEVEIPVFVISKKERAVVPKAEKEKIGIFKDGDDLPVFQNFYSPERSHGGGEKNEEEVRDELERLKKISHKIEPEVLAEKPKNHRRREPLSEKRKRIIMWGSVAVLACLIFFIWLSGFLNNFSNLFGSASYTFSREDGILEEVPENIKTEEISGNGEAGNTEDALDQIREKILVEELKGKLER